MKYEYKIVRSQTEMTSSQLNLLSQKGWELVSVVLANNMFWSYYLRKEKTK